MTFITQVTTFETIPHREMRMHSALVSLDAPGSGRRRVLLLLKMNGAQTAAQLAKELEVTAVAIRQHLVALQEEGVVAFAAAEPEPGRVGRPAHLWRLTKKACERFPDAHAGLAVEVLLAVEDAFGKKGLNRLAAERTRKQIASYRARMPRRRSTMAQRVAALTKIRCADGFLAEWKRNSDGTATLIENHCCIERAAQTCPALCDGELDLFESVLGNDVLVQRVEHLLQGDRRCAYRIEPSPKTKRRNQGRK